MESEAALLDRVRKLLALATSPNAHEAAAAARRAQLLIEKHRLAAALERLDAVDVDPITDGLEAPLESARRLRTWKLALAAALAELNAAATWVASAGAVQRLCVVGRHAHRERVRALYDGLVRRIEWSSATAGPGRPRSWHEAFRVGVVDAIVGRLGADADEAPPDEAPPTEALVRVESRAAGERAALERFLTERFGPERGRSLRVDARAYARGRREGARVALPVPPGAGPRNRR